MAWNHILKGAGGLALLASLGCNISEQLRKVEFEVTDTKVEIFKLRQQVEEANRKADAERLANEEARGLDRRFQADLQETLRQLQDSTRILNNRLGDSPRPARVHTKHVDAREHHVESSEEEKAFGAAVLDYNRGNYPIAAESLELFLKSSPSSSKRPDALFYLGLSQWHQKIYDKAKNTFDRIIREHSASSQFLPAKLKRAQCLLKMGLKPASVKALKEITEGFPGTPEARTALQELADLGM